MRHLWISGVVIVALLGAGCGSSTDKASGHRHRHRHVATTTTTTTAGTTAPSTAVKLTSGPKDKVACTTLVSLGADAHKSHRVIANDFRKVFRALKHAENSTLRVEGRKSASELLKRNVRRFKTSFNSLFQVCNEMGLT